MKTLFLIALLFSVSVAIAGTLVYTYDEGGRLEQATFEHTGGSFSYEMDAAGNIKEQITDPVPEPALLMSIGLCVFYIVRREHGGEGAGLL